jgi:endonuclease/exonuclease/phosphatase family metal-dependent hydrolase
VYVLLALVGGVALATYGCQSPLGRRNTELPNKKQAISVVVDGCFDEWPKGATAMADEDYLYLRTPAGHETNLQKTRPTIAIWLDMDDDDDTGRTDRLQPTSKTYGFDLEVEFSPHPSRKGAAIYANPGEDRRVPIALAAVDAMHAPTFAAEEFEVRISRQFAGGFGLPLKGLNTNGAVSGVIVTRTRTGDATVSKTFRVSAPCRRESLDRAEKFIPPRPRDGLRVVSYNVLYGSPVGDPAPFGRILRSLDPDIVLIQEWFEIDAVKLARWFKTNVSEKFDWHAATAPNMGLAIVSRHAVGQRPITNEIPGLRCLAADVHTPFGDVAAVSVHLACCGSAGSKEDQRRVVEAEAIHEVIRRLERSMIVAGGDLNLVGSRKPLEVLCGGHSQETSLLKWADTLVLGDSAIYTWRSPTDIFLPGRLDYLLFSDPALEPINAFALDTLRLSRSFLDEASLMRDDSEASDHIPIVLDVRPRR